MTGFQMGCKNPNLMLLQPFQRFRRSYTKNGNRKYCTQTGPDHIGVVPIRLGVAQQHCIHPGSIGGAQNGTQITGFFHRFE